MKSQGRDGVYEEEVPTLPWWVESGPAVAARTSGDSSRWVLLVVVLLVLALALVAAVGTVASA